MGDPARESIVLRREVLPPPSRSPGWGLIVIATTALSFALAGSLLMVRASMEVARARRALPVVVDVSPEPATVVLTPPVTTPAVAPAVAPAPVAAPDPCQGPVYHPAADGTTEAVFSVCPTPKRAPIIHVVDY